MDGELRSPLQTLPQELTFVLHLEGQLEQLLQLSFGFNAKDALLFTLIVTALLLFNEGRALREQFCILGGSRGEQFAYVAVPDEPIVVTVVLAEEQEQAVSCHVNM